MIGIVAPSSVVPKVELTLAITKLREAGFKTRTHAQVRRRHQFFSGTDSERAEGFLEFACNPEISVLWCGRGGSGAIRTLDQIRYLESKGTRVPHGKLLVGYSDATLLMEYARKHWGWSTLHGPMPGLREFSVLRESHQSALFALIRGEKAESPALAKPLKWITAAPKKILEGELVGGNLTVWASAIGTPFQCDARGKILFLEDVGEPPYRIDRTLSQLQLAGQFNGVQAIVLGTFERCEDAVPSVLKVKPKEKDFKRVLRAPKASELKPLRPRMAKAKILRELFGEIGDRLKIPVAEGLPVGHGPEYPPLPLGAIYQLEIDGHLLLKQWSWLKKTP